MFCLNCSIKSQPIEFDITRDASCSFETGESKWSKVLFTWDSISRTYIQEQASGDIYNDDSENCVRIKCLALIPSTLLMTVVRIIEHVVKKGFSDLAKVPYYGLLSIKAACIGIIDPFAGRKEYSLYERSLFGNPDRVDKKRDFYLASCFQPLNCNIENKHDKQITLLLLKRRILRSLQS